MNRKSTIKTRFDRDIQELILFLSDRDFDRHAVDRLVKYFDKNYEKTVNEYWLYGLYASKTGQIGLALQSFERVLQINSKDVDALNNYLWAAFELQDYELVTSHIERNIDDLCSHPTEIALYYLYSCHIMGKSPLESLVRALKSSDVQLVFNISNAVKGRDFGRVSKLLHELKTIDLIAPMWQPIVQLGMHGLFDQVAHFKRLRRQIEGNNILTLQLIDLLVKSHRLYSALALAKNFPNQGEDFKVRYFAIRLLLIGENVEKSTAQWDVVILRRAVNFISQLLGDSEGSRHLDHIREHPKSDISDFFFAEYTRRKIGLSYVRRDDCVMTSLNLRKGEGEGFFRSPFYSLSVTDDAALISRCTQTYIRERALRGEYSLAGRPDPRSEGPTQKRKNGLPLRRRLRVGYVSSDLVRRHPVADLCLPVLARHDRQSFSIYSVAITSKKTDSDLVRTNKNTFEKYIEISSRDIAGAIHSLRECDFDIIVDLNGLTEFQIPELWFERLAPIRVNWLGYPGTISELTHDVVIVDRVILERHGSQNFNEVPVALPHCYQPNAGFSYPSDVDEARIQLNVGNDTFVLGCMCSGYKVSRSRLQQILMLATRLGRGVEIWFYASSSEWAANVSAYIQADQSLLDLKVRFLEPRPRAEFYKIMNACDALVDTHPYGGHTTAAEARWLGIPYLTTHGRSFQSAVAESINANTLGLGHVFDSWESLQNFVCSNREELRQGRRTREKGRAVTQNTPLFNANSFIRDLERLYMSL